MNCNYGYKNGDDDDYVVNDNYGDDTINATCISILIYTYIRLRYLLLPYFIVTSNFKFYFVKTIYRQNNSYTSCRTEIINSS
jgi:hypothetical protein